jgi:hypothetical protein
MPGNYTFYQNLKGINNISYWMNIDNTGNTAFNLEVLACSIILTFKGSLSTE